MATSNRLLLAILLALAACKMSTNNLEPKTDEECAAIGEKACGYKCVTLDDPATGCGYPKCGACPAQPPHMVPWCTPEHQCDGKCESGWSNCDADLVNGCETEVGGSDASNCGACERSCGAGLACSGGICQALGIHANGLPRGIVYEGGLAGRMFWMDDASYGEMMCWDPAAGGYQVATGLDPRLGSPAVYRVAIEQVATAAPRLYATGAMESLPGSYDMTIFQVDPAGQTAPIPVFEDPQAFDGEAFLGLAAARGGVFYTREGGTAEPCFAQVGSPVICTTAGASDVRGLTAIGSQVVFGYPDANGALSEISISLAEKPIYRDVGSWPSRIAGFTVTGNVVSIWFWADESNGNVWAVYAGDTTAVPIQVDSGSGATLMDITADSWGVVWTDYYGSKVRAWRAKDNFIFDLASGAQPLGVAMSPTHIYWTDAQNNMVYRVSK